MVRDNRCAGFQKSLRDSIVTHVQWNEPIREITWCNNLKLNKNHPLLEYESDQERVYTSPINPSLFLVWLPGNLHILLHKNQFVGLWVEFHYLYQYLHTDRCWIHRISERRIPSWLILMFLLLEIYSYRLLQWISKKGWFLTITLSSRMRTTICFACLKVNQAFFR